MGDGESGSATLRGIVFLIGAVTVFAVVDAVSKLLISSHSFGQVMLGRYAPALIVLLAVTPPARWRGMFATQKPGLQIARGMLPMLIGGAMVLGVKYLPLADATTILFAGPFFVLALSGVLLGERVAAASWVGVVLGFAGVLIVARPGFSALSAYALFPAVGALFYAGYQLLTRHLAASGETTEATVAWTLLIGILASLPLALADWRAVDAQAFALSLVMGAAMGIGQILVPRAYQRATANVLAPFTYFQIFAAVALGFLLFREVPDIWTMAGIALIVVSGVAVFGGSRTG